MLGILTAAVSVYYYLRVVTKLYFTSEEGTAAMMDVSFVEAFVLLVASGAIVLLGLFPSSLLNILQTLG